MRIEINQRQDTPGLASAFQAGQNAFLANYPLSTALVDVPPYARESFTRGWRQEFEDYSMRPIEFIPGV